MKQAIVIGCHVNGLGVIRSLHWKKFRIVAMYYNPKADFAHASKFVDESVQIPHPAKAEKEFIDLLLKNASIWKDALLIDTNDDVSIAISKNKAKLDPFFTVIPPEWDILRKLMEKSETYQLAQQCKVPFPKTFFPKSLRELQELKSEILYPCILKPVLGHTFFSQFNIKNFPVHNFEELTAKFAFCMKTGHPVLVQEIIPGPDSNFYQIAMYISRKGEICSPFGLRKIRQTPPRFGVARVAVSEPINLEILEYTQRMLKAIGFHGIVHSEFKKDPRDNQFKLMEINGRLARSNWLPTYCGVNYPWIAAQDLMENVQLQSNGYKNDVYWIELSKDVSNSIFLHNKENLRIRDYIQPYLAKEKTFADLSRNDMRPFLKRFGNALKLKES